MRCRSTRIRTARDFVDAVWRLGNPCSRADADDLHHSPTHSSNRRLSVRGLIAARSAIFSSVTEEDRFPSSQRKTTGADRLIGALANYIGFAALAGVGVFIFHESYETDDTSPFKVDSGWGLLAACASISLDSFGIGVSLPGVPLPLAPLLATVAVSTIIFTATGLAFGAQLGHRYKQFAGRVAAIVLIVLAVFFTVQHLLGWVA